MDYRGYKTHFEIHEMNAKSFFELVGNMRAAQKEFFRTKSPSALAESKQLERAVDAADAMGFDLTGIELDAEYYNAAKERLLKQQSEPQLFAAEDFVGSAWDSGGSLF